MNFKIIYDGTILCIFQIKAKFILNEARILQGNLNQPMTS